MLLLKHIDISSRIEESYFVQCIIIEKPKKKNRLTYCDESKKRSQTTYIAHKCKNIVRTVTGPCSEFDNVSGCRCVSDCRSRGREFDPGPVPYFHGD